MFWVIYALLITPWPGTQARFARWYREVGNDVIGDGLFGGRVRFQPQTDGATLFDTKIILHNDKTGAQKVMPYSSRYGAFLPGATLVALVVATPLPWRRRGVALLWGLLLTAAFVALRHCLLILAAYADRDLVGYLKMNDFLMNLLLWVSGFLGMAPLSNVMAPLVIWLAVITTGGEAFTLGIRGLRWRKPEEGGDLP